MAITSLSIHTFQGTKALTVNKIDKKNYNTLFARTEWNIFINIKVDLKSFCLVPELSSHELHTKMYVSFVRTRYNLWT